MSSLASRTPDPYFDHWHNGHTYRGVAYPEQPLLYMAKNRNRADLPSIWTAEGGAAPLGEEIHEPMFLSPISGTPAVATLGTSGAASPTAVGRWLTAYLAQGRELSFELHPVFLGNVRQLMEAAVGATSLEVGVRSEEFEPRSTGHVENALREAVEGTGRMGTARIRISLGPGNHGHGDPRILEEGSLLLGNPAVKNGKVRVRIPDDDKGFRSELLDLVSHRFTHRVRTGGDDESLSIETAMPALHSGVKEFMKTNEYRSLRQEAAVD